MVVVMTVVVAGFSSSESSNISSSNSIAVAVLAAVAVSAAATLAHEEPRQQRNCVSGDGGHCRSSTGGSKEGWAHTPIQEASRVR